MYLVKLGLRIEGESFEMFLRTYSFLEQREEEMIESEKDDQVIYRHLVVPTSDGSIVGLQSGISPRVKLKLILRNFTIS
jgi:hypothetical protein